MSATGLDVFDTTVQKTNRWLKDIAQAAGWHEKQDKQKAYLALRSTRHALRDCLTVEEVGLGFELHCQHVD